jgi:hypothetical protein
MKISLLVPSRERLNLKLTLISSLISSCKDIKNIELIFGTDDDDPKRGEIERICGNLNFVKNINIHNNNKFIGINKIWNILYEHAAGDIIGYIGDDMVFKTPDWDSMILEEFEGDNIPGDDFKLVHCYDGFHDGDKICVNAFTTRKYYEMMGYFTRPEFLINWSDQWMYQCYKAFDRVTYRRDIHIQHNHWVRGDRARDNVADRMHGNLRSAGIDRYGDINSYSDRLWLELRDVHQDEIRYIGSILDLEPNWSVVDSRGRDDMLAN